ncbi:MAG: bile acid:sodium symporter family protein [Syntrophobacteraceae bacterium]
MLRFKDGLMLLCVLCSISTGILLPGVGAPFQPYPMHSMMVLLFFSFLSVLPSAMIDSLKGSLLKVGQFVFIKMILFPLLVYGFFLLTFPRYAPAALLLSGISSGVAAPFFAILVNANMSIVFGMVFASSILVPFTLPALVKILLGTTIDISFIAMFRLLCIVVFVPLILAEIVRRLSPHFADRLFNMQYPVSLVCFTVTNLGIFSKYAPFLREEPFTVAAALGISFILAGICFLGGIAFSSGQNAADRLAVVISFGFMNSVLVLVFSSEFFGPLEPTVAAMYTVPFFMLIVPLRLYQGWIKRNTKARGPSDN